MEHPSRFTSWISLAAAALVGASVVAVSALWLHKRAIDQLLDRSYQGHEASTTNASAIKKAQRHHKSGRTPSPAPVRHVRSRSCSRERSSTRAQEGSPHGNGHDGTKSQHTSHTMKTTDSDVDLECSSQTYFNNLSSIPPGLPRVQTHKEGANNHLSPTRRAGPLGNSAIRPSTPKSPVGGSTFDNMESSDGEDNSSDRDEQAYGYGEVNGDGHRPESVLSRKEETMKASGPAVPAEFANGTGEKSGSAMIRSHSIPGELHGIHAPDPVAADILRKEPEQETFVRLQITPIERES